MIGPKRIITITGTLFCALATGFIVQNAMRDDPRGMSAGVQMASVGKVQDVAPMAEEDAKVMSDAPRVGPEAAATETPALTGRIPTPPAPAPQPRTLPDVPVTLAALDDQPITGLPAEEPAPAFGCEIDFAAEPMAAAMVELTLSAPCMVNERFTLHHGAMIFTAATDDEGQATIQVPALSETAIFIATFSTGKSAVARAEVDTLKYYDRAVVQWSGPSGPQLHALEYGAGYGGDGHVWAGAPRDLAIAARGAGGFLTRLGDDSLPGARLAEIYTFPSGTAPREGDIRLSLEVEVTKANCGQDIAAQTLQKSAGERMQARELSVAVPDCDAIGDFLVLKNLFHDLNITRN